MKLTPVTPPAFPPANPVATVIPKLVAAFVLHNPSLAPDLAARMAQVFGQAGFSAQYLVSTGGLRDSTVIPGLVVNAQGLPVFMQQPITNGTVLAQDDGFGGYVMGCWHLPDEAGSKSPDASEGHVSTAIGTIWDIGSTPHWLTVITPGTDYELGPVGSVVA